MSKSLVNFARFATGLPALAILYAMRCDWLEYSAVNWICALLLAAIAIGCSSYKGILDHRERLERVFE